MAAPIATAKIGTSNEATYLYSDVVTGGGVSSITLTGAGTADGGATIASYKWYIISQPPEGTAVLSSSTAQNPTLGPISKWGNYRVLLVVTDSTGTTSATDPLLAPDSAFATVRVRGPNVKLSGYPGDPAAIGLIKPAATERNWYDEYWELVEAVSNNANRWPVIEHTDVTSCTGPNLDELVSGDYTTLHKHQGDSIAASTPSAPGTVRLRDTPADAASPKAVNYEYFVYTAQVWGSFYIDLRNGVTTPLPYWIASTDTSSLTGAGQGGAFSQDGLSHVVARPHVMFTLPKTGASANLTMDLWQVTVNMADSGFDAGGSGSYQFKVVEGTAAEWAANALIDGAGGLDSKHTITGSVGTARSPLSIDSYVGGSVQLSDAHFGLVCTGAPANIGGGMSVTIILRHRV